MRTNLAAWTPSCIGLVTRPYFKKEEESQAIRRDKLYKESLNINSAYGGIVNFPPLCWNLLLIEKCPGRKEDIKVKMKVCYPLVD